MIVFCKSQNGYITTYAPERILMRERDAIQLDRRLSLKNNIGDQRNLNMLIDIWYKLHGVTLRDHARLCRLLYRISRALDNPIAKSLTTEQFAKYRQSRITEDNHA